MKSVTALATGSLAALATAQSSNIQCQDGVHIIVARASLEPPGYGILAGVKDAILGVIPNSDSVAVPYPATIYGPITYPVSEPEGVGNATRLVKEYGDACPGHKMVLMGYSQGAQVVGDTVIGASYNPDIFPTTTGLEDRYLNDVVALILMGDPAFIPNLPINIGNATNGSTFPRTNSAQWEARGLTNRTQSYCDSGDTFCDRGNMGGISLAIHLRYVPEYGTQAAIFVSRAWALATGNPAPANDTVSVTVSPYNSTTTTTAAGTGSTGPATSTTMSTGTGTHTGAATTTSSGGAAQTSAPGGAATDLSAGRSTVMIAAALQCLLALFFAVAL